MREDQVEVLLNSRATRVAKSANRLELTVESGGKPQTISGTHLLAAAGRVPNTDWLNTSAAGIATDKRGYIQGNERLEPTEPGVFPLGDIKGGPASTDIL